MTILDVFSGNAFNVVSLTNMINKLPYVPGRIGQLGLFGAGRGVATTTIAIEERNGLLVLVAPTPRGGPGQTLPKSKRGLRNLTVPHFEINDAIMAEEVQGVRAFGQEQAVETVMGKVAERSVIHVQSMGATTEFSRIGAVKGVVTYADGTTLNLFTEFGVSQINEIAFDLSNGSAVDGSFRKACAGVVRTMANELGNIPFSGVHAFCGDNFFDDMLENKEVRDSYKNTPMAQVLREGYVLPSGNKIFGVFEFGGIVWENYRGAVGSTAFIDPDKCHLMPMGVPGLFDTVWAPADYVETVNTIGRRLYEKQYAMPNDKGVHLDVQMNEINYCTRPRVLVQGRRGS